MPNFELTLRGFDGGTDDTDDLILWITSEMQEDEFREWLDSREMWYPEGEDLIQTVNLLAGHTLWEDIDFYLPAEADEFERCVNERCGVGFKNPPPLRAPAP